MALSNMTSKNTSYGDGSTSLWDYAVDRVAKALNISTHEGERVALSWQGNTNLDAFKLLEAARQRAGIA